MEELVFVEKDAIPNENVIIAALRESYPLYRMIHEKIEVKRPNIQTEWKYYGKKNGWLLKHLDAKNRYANRNDTQREPPFFFLLNRRTMLNKQWN